MNTIERKNLSDLVLNILSAGDGLNILADKNFLKDMMHQSRNPEMAETAMTKWKSFKKFIKSKNLRLNYFVLAFAEGEYFFLYEVGSKISDNTPPVMAKIEFSEDFSDNTPFEKVPSIFAIWLDAILSIPYPNLLGLSEE